MFNVINLFLMVYTGNKSIAEYTKKNNIYLTSLSNYKEQLKLLSLKTKKIFSSEDILFETSLDFFFTFWEKNVRVLF